MGAGRPRVAIAVAEELVDRYDEGVWFVDLAATSSAELVVTQIASDLEVREGDEHGPQGPMALLKTYLGGRQLLLVLDNCEHVVAEVSGRGRVATLVVPRVFACWRPLVSRSASSARQSMR